MEKQQRLASSQLLYGNVKVIVLPVVLFVKSSRITNFAPLCEAPVAQLGRAADS